MKYIAVVGSRGFNDYNFFKEKVDYYTENLSVFNYNFFKEKVDYYTENLSDFQFVSGGAKSGADNLIKRYCKENNFNLIEFLPDWKTHGKAAGPIRNKLIVDKSDLLIAFWDKKSRGTKNSIDNAQEKGIPYRIIYI